MGKGIPHELIHKAYAAGKAINEKKLTFSAGVRQLADADMNTSSATAFLHDIKQLFKGAVYKRALSGYATDYFLTHIEKDFGPDALRLACESVGRHLDYWNTLNKGRQRAIEALLEKKLAQLPPIPGAPRLVASFAEIRRNLLSLERYRQSTDPAAREFFGELVKNGICYVAYTLKGRVLFGPSRFIGYADNSIAAHGGHKDKDGRETNVAIERALGESFGPDAGLEKKFVEFCAHIGLTPQDRSRKYIAAGALPDEEVLVDDLREIDKQSGIKETEKKRLVDSRIGQGWFRDALLKLWGCCKLTNCADPRLLRASHIKPWKPSTHEERLDPYNGLLLSPNLDQAFDRGLITFEDSGNIVFSSKLLPADAQSLGITTSMKLTLHAKNLPYLEFHRKSVFLK